MSTGAWTPPRLAPRGSTLAADGSVVRQPIGTHGVSRTVPAPLLQQEVDLRRRPAAGALFPVHPIGVTELYERAVECLTPIPVLQDLGEESKRQLLDECWRIADALYSPGASVRDSVDRMSQPSAYRRPDTNGSGARTPLHDRLTHTAAWAVLRAAGEWSEETP